MPASSS